MKSIILGVLLTTAIFADININQPVRLSGGKTITFARMYPRPSFLPASMGPGMAGLIAQLEGLSAGSYRIVASIRLVDGTVAVIEGTVMATDGRASVLLETTGIVDSLQAITVHQTTSESTTSN